MSNEHKPRAFAPHCDARILHAPKECQYCDKYADWQALRIKWQIAFTGKEPVELPPIDRWAVRGPVLPCPADFIRGDSHTKWGGNVAQPEAVGKCYHCGTERAESELIPSSLYGFKEKWCAVQYREKCSAGHMNRKIAEAGRRAKIVTLKSEIAQREADVRSLENET